MSEAEHANGVAERRTSRKREEGRRRSASAVWLGRRSARHWRAWIWDPIAICTCGTCDHRMLSPSYRFHVLSNERTVSQDMANPQGFNPLDGKSPRKMPLYYDPSCVRFLIVSFILTTCALALQPDLPLPALRGSPNPRLSRPSPDVHLLPAPKHNTLPHTPLDPIFINPLLITANHLPRYAFALARSKTGPLEASDAEK